MNGFTFHKHIKMSSLCVCVCVCVCVCASVWVNVKKRVCETENREGKRREERRTTLCLSVLLSFVFSKAKLRHFQHFANVFFLSPQ